MQEPKIFNLVIKVITQKIIYSNSKNSNMLLHKEMHLQMLKYIL